MWIFDAFLFCVFLNIFCKKTPNKTFHLNRCRIRYCERTWLQWEAIHKNKINLIRKERYSSDKDLWITVVGHLISWPVHWLDQSADASFTGLVPPSAHTCTVLYSWFLWFIWIWLNHLMFLRQKMKKRVLVLLHGYSKLILHISHLVTSRWNISLIIKIITTKIRC